MLDKKLIIKIIATAVVVVAMCVVCSAQYRLLLASVGLLIWSKELVARLPHWSILAGVVALLWGVMLSLMPYRGFDANRALNIIYADGDSMRTESPVGLYLLNCLIPEQELRRGEDVGSWKQRRLTESSQVALRHSHLNPIYVAQPELRDSGMIYHLVIMAVDSAQHHLELQQQIKSLDSCVMVTVVPKPGDIGIINRVADFLEAHQVAVDTNYISLVDATSNAVLARRATQGHTPVLRNIIFWNNTPEHADSTVSRVVQIGPQPNADVYETMKRWQLDADVITIPRDSTTQAVRAIEQVLSGNNRVSQSRLENTHAEALQLGMDERFAMFVDYTIPSGKNRFFVYDYDLNRIVLQSRCAHGCGVGSTNEVPVFSNLMGSNATSLGDFEVLDVRAMFKNGRIAIDLNGMDTTNNNARLRGIMIHGGMHGEGENYPEYLKIGKLSEGCVALSDYPFMSVVMLVKNRPKRIMLSAYCPYHQKNAYVLPPVPADSLAMPGFAPPAPTF